MQSKTDMLSYLFKFKLIFVRELVPFEKWYQEAKWIWTVNSQSQTGAALESSDM